MPSRPLLSLAGQSVLLLVDLQEKLLASLAPVPRTALLKQAEILAEAARLLDIPILQTQQYPRGLGNTAESLRSIAASAITLEKTRFSCCGVPAVDEFLNIQQRPCVVIAGVEAHICVMQTALQLFQAGFASFVVEDAVASRHSDHKHNALARLRQAGVVVSNTESTLFEWLGDAQNPHFKAISALIR